jgi:hypothetical protein
MLHRMWLSALKHATWPGRLVLRVRLDEDDETVPLVEAMEALKDQSADGYWDARVTVGPRRLLGEYWNELAAQTDAEILWHGNDDVVFRTYGWDTAVREGFAQWPDRIGCVHGRDGIHDRGQATLGFYSREWCDVLGYPLIPPYFASDWGDTWLSAVADAIGRRHYDERIYTEHTHFVAGKRPRDATDDDRERAGQAQGVQALYYSLAAERDADAAKLRAAILAWSVRQVEVRP